MVGTARTLASVVLVSVTTMRARLSLFIGLSLLATLGALNASGAMVVVDQSQPGFTVTGDIATSGKSGQSFTAGISGSLTAIRLVVEGKGYSGTGVFGSDFILSLWSTAPVGTPTHSLLASGTFSRSGLPPDRPQWVTITFEAPYQQTAGEALAFTINEATSGAAGFNEYGGKTTNPYGGGQMFFDFTEGQPLTASSYDLAFETHVVPEPASISLPAAGAAVVMLRRPVKRRRQRVRSDAAF
jgi:hypothetical protein